MAQQTPRFAILGHPNEGKSSVVSTLAENDQVPVTPTPGETRECHFYPVQIDGREVVEFVDTPGFQRPRDTLNWLREHDNSGGQVLDAFLRAHQNDDGFADECELFRPLAQDAAIIFVVDSSRPLRNTDRIEMEILRLTGLPRMVVINTKEHDAPSYMETWKSEARKHFNTLRVFDAHQANFSQRMDLLEGLKAVDLDWAPPLQEVIDTFKADWEERIEQSASIITRLLADVTCFETEKHFGDKEPTAQDRENLIKKYENEIADRERDAHKEIGKNFRHERFSYEMPSASIVQEDLFSEQTWRVLGMNRWQLAATGAGTGAGVGAAVDTAFGGLAFGVFTAGGSVIGGGSAAFGHKRIAAKMAKSKYMRRLGGYSLKVGPLEKKHHQLLFVMIDRALMYFFHVVNWAHGRRDHGEEQIPPDFQDESFLTKGWGQNQRKTAQDFFKTAHKNHDPTSTPESDDFHYLLVDVLRKISGHDTANNNQEHSKRNKDEANAASDTSATDA